VHVNVRSPSARRNGRLKIENHSYSGIMGDESILPVDVDETRRLPRQFRVNKVHAMICPNPSDVLIKQASICFLFQCHEMKVA
jgi:hypothetical protein